MDLISLVQLIATPERWFGERVSVTGYLGSFSSLFLSRERADALDSAVRVVTRTREESDALAACQGRWVHVEGLVESNLGLPELTRVERVWTGADGPHCWPPGSRPSQVSSTTYRNNRSSNDSRNDGS